MQKDDTDVLRIRNNSDVINTHMIYDKLKLGSVVVVMTITACEYLSRSNVSNVKYYTTLLVDILRNSAYNDLKSMGHLPECSCKLCHDSFHQIILHLMDVNNHIDRFWATSLVNCLPIDDFLRRDCNTTQNYGSTNAL